MQTERSKCVMALFTLKEPWHIEEVSLLNRSALAQVGDRCRLLPMHKDKPPGIFDLGDRSMRYAAGFCFLVGFVISVLVRVGMVLAREHFSQTAPWSGS